MIRLALLLALVPLQAIAHPHIFIAAGFEIVTDEQGNLTGIRTTWDYDEFYSLMILEDLGLDRDYDSVLNTAEQAALNGFDMKWVEGFNGDLVATLDGEPLSLTGPLETTAALRDGRIVTTHLRKVTGTPELTGHILMLKPYDPTYYTAYEVTLPVTVPGREGCLIESIPPEIDSALANMQQKLSTLDPSMNPEDAGLPDIGADFATEVEIQCPAS